MSIDIGPAATAVLLAKQEGLLGEYQNGEIKKELPQLLNGLLATVNNRKLYVDFEWLQKTSSDHGVDLVILSTRTRSLLIRTCFLKDKMGTFLNAFVRFSLQICMKRSALR